MSAVSYPIRQHTLSLDQSSMGAGRDDVRRDLKMPRRPSTIVRDWNGAVEATILELAADVLRQLASYGELRPAWDGYRGQEFDESTITRARLATELLAAALLKNQTLPREITPGPAPDGSIDVEAIVGSRCLIASFDPRTPYEIHLYFETEEGEIESDLHGDTTVLAPWIDRLIGSTVVSTGASHGWGSSVGGEALAVGL